MSLIFIHHLLQSFILPPFNSIILIIIGIWLLNKSKEVGKAIIVVSCITLYMQSTPFFVYTLAGVIEQPSISQQQLDTTQALVILGGGIRNNAYEYPSKLSPNSFTLVRLQYAAFLAKQNTQKLIIVSGGIAAPGKHSEAEIMKDTLQKTFKVTNPILVEEKSRNTDENAKYVAQILKQLNITKIAVVSQAFHLSRATALFRKYGIIAIPASTDYMGHYDRLLSTANFIPDAGTMANCAALLHELFGYIVYVNLTN